MVGNIADQCKENFRHGDGANHIAILIDDEAHEHVFRLKNAQCFQDARRARNVEWRRHVREQFVIRFRIKEQILKPNHTDERPIRATPHRIAHIAVLTDERKIMLHRFSHIEPDELHARRHDFGNAHIAEMEDTVHDIALNMLDSTRGRAFFDQVPNFVFRYLWYAAPGNAVKLEHGIRGPGKKGNGRSEQPCNAVHRPRNERGDGLRVGERHPLRHEFADDEREIGDDDDDETEGDRLRARTNKRPVRHHLAQGTGKRRPAKCTCKDADQRDADLHDRQEAARLRLKLESSFSTHGRCAGLSAPRGERLKTLAARRHDGHFRHREKPVQQDQNEQDDDVRKHGVPGAGE